MAANSNLAFFGTPVYILKDIWSVAIQTSLLKLWFPDRDTCKYR